MANDLLYIPITDLHPREDNLRDDANGDDLVESMKHMGVLEPLNVTPRDDFDGYWINAGHRRLDAASKAGIAMLPAIVFNGGTGDVDVTAIMLVENLQRRDLDVVEEAKGFARLVELGWSQKQIAEQTGFHASVISRRVKLAKLPSVFHTAIKAGDMNLDQAEEFVPLVELDVDRAIDLAFGDKGYYGWEIQRTIDDIKFERATAKLRSKLESAGLTFVPPAEVQPRFGAMASGLYKGDLETGDTYTWLLLTHSVVYEAGTEDEVARDELVQVGTGPLDIQAALDDDEIHGVTVVKHPEKGALIVAVQREVVMTAEQAIAAEKGDEKPSQEQLNKLADKRKRADERAKQAHELEQQQAMVSSKLVKGDVVDWIIRDWMEAVHQVSKEKAAKILGLEPVTYEEKQHDGKVRNIKNWPKTFDQAVEAATGQGLVRCWLALVIGDSYGGWGQRAELYTDIQGALGYQEFNASAPAGE